MSKKPTSNEENLDYCSKLRSRSASTDTESNPFATRPNLQRTPILVPSLPPIGELTQNIVDNINRSPTDYRSAEIIQPFNIESDPSNNKLLEIST